MDEAIYLTDSFIREWQAEVTSVKNGKFVVLDRTAFYPSGGGQPHDTGTISEDGREFRVVYTGKFDGKISHETEKDGLKRGDKVNCVIDWERRYRHMRMHTTAHILCEVLFRETGALITGNQIGEEKTRIDFDLENYRREKIDDYVETANEIIKKDLPVKIKFLPREEAVKIPRVSKLAKGLPENMELVRIVSVGDFDVQADGGTHVKLTKEIGQVKLLKVDNRGKNNRRIYFTLENAR